MLVPLALEDHNAVQTNGRFKKSVGPRAGTIYVDAMRFQDLCSQGDARLRPKRASDGEKIKPLTETLLDRLSIITF